MKMTITQLAEALYEAYRDASAGLCPDGSPMPTWGRAHASEHTKWHKVAQKAARIEDPNPPEGG